MNYLSGALRYVAGTDSDEANLVPRLTDRIKTSALPNDRRAAIIQLTTAAKQSPQRQADVGEHSIKLIYAVLEQDADLDETVKATLDLLIALCGALEPPPDLSTAVPPSSPTAQSNSKSARNRDAFLRESRAAAATNIDAFLGLPNALHLLLALLSRPDFYLKFATIELLTAMSANSRDTLQAAILDAPQGVTRICDVLDDPHRHIRSNAVLLLSALVDRSPEICKIVVFAGAFEKLFSFVDAVAASAHASSDGASGSRNQDDPSSESGGHAHNNGLADDGDDEDSVEDAIVVQDVLVAVRNLLLGAPSTRTFFRDSACIPRLVVVLRRAATDAALADPETAKSSAATSAPALRAALEAQARRNLLVAMQCVAALVAGTDDETRLVKNELATTNVFKTLVTLSFTRLHPPNVEDYEQQGSFTPPENLLSVRVAALRTIAGLVRGHEDFRTAFAAPVPGATIDDDDDPALSPSGPVVALRATRSDPSAAVRLAAFCALRDSFITDAGLGLPASAFLAALAAGGGDASTAPYGLADSRSLSHGSLSAGVAGSPSDAAADVADTLKHALASGPAAGVGPAGVFYAAALFGWVAAAAPDARERLLGSHAHGAGLLPQIVRTLGRLERERGPPAARVALFALLCIWLHGSTASVSAFLSSAMHLPMLIDIFQSGGARGDAAEVHVRGLAAVVLGICLQAADTADTSSDAGFLSGGGGASVAVSRSTVADIIRTRVGVTVFTSALDDLRATRAYTAGAFDAHPWKLSESIIPREDAQGYASITGELGFDNWYQSSLFDVVDDVYKHVSAVALNLLSEPAQPPKQVTKTTSTNEMNGHVTGPLGPENESVLADSARDEVLQSYKEFIRTQDESLNAARVQIDELSTALREAQLELDAKTAEVSSAQVSDAVAGLRRENKELEQAKDTLEALLSEKSKDFIALSEAFASLEEEQMAQGGGEDQNAETLADDLRKISSERDVLQQTLDMEMRKNMDLSRRTAELNDSMRIKDAELLAISNERQALSSNVHPDVVEALQWRTRAEVAENKLQTRAASNETLESDKAELEAKLNDAEKRSAENAALAESLRESVASAKAEVESLRSSRNRELQVSRETSASSAAAQGEVEVLRKELAEARDQIADLENTTSQPMSEETAETLKKIREDNVNLRKSLDQVKTELADSRQAVSQWQKRAEAAEAAKERAELESARLSNTTKSLERKNKSLVEELESEKQSSTASQSQVSELQQQMTELEEMRRRQEEENNELKEELSIRTEQSIKLSGKMYEMEESRSKMEAKLEELQSAAPSESEAPPSNKETTIPANTVKIEQLQAKITTLQAEVDKKTDALTDLQDKQDLLLAQVKDREEAVNKASDLEADVVKWKEMAETSATELEMLQTRLLSLDQAEESKRVLTMQVVELQGQLRNLEAGPAVPTQGRTEDNDRFGALQKELSEVREVSEARFEKLTTVERDFATASTKLEELDQALQSSHIELSNAQETIATTTEKLSNSEKKVGEYEANADELAESVKESASRLSETQAALTRMKDELAEAQAALHLSSKQTADLELRGKKLGEEKSDIESQLQESRTNFAKLEAEVATLNQVAERAKTSNPAATEQLVSVQAKLEESEQRCVVLEEKLATLNDASIEVQKAAEEQTSNLLDQKGTLAADLANMQAQLSSVQTTSDNDVLAISVEHVVNSVILDAALTASVTESDTQITKLQIDLDTASTETASLHAHVGKMKSLETELESAKARCVEQADELDSLKSELQSLRKTLAARADVSTRLDEASATVKALNAERDALTLELNEARSALEGSTTVEEGQSVSSVPTEQMVPSKRISELEAALRDAARTVSTTNRELIAAQALLVELSSDKTAMRAELSDAEARIAELTKAAAVVTMDKSLNTQTPSMTGALSEVSDPDQMVTLDVPEATSEQTQLSINAAHSEAENLRVALDRSMTEANSATTLLDCIHTKMAEVESMLHASRESIQASKSSERSLEEKLHQLQLSYSEEKAQMLRNEETLNAQIAHIEQARDAEKAQYEASILQTSEKAAQEVSTLQDEITKQENMLADIRTEASSLRENLTNTTSALANANASVAKLETTEQNLDARLRATQKSLDDRSATLADTELREQAVRQTLAETEEKLCGTIRAHERERKQKQEKWEHESREYEEEIDRCTKTLEDAEAVFCETESKLKHNISRIEDQLADVTTELDACKTSLQSCEEKLASALAERDRIEAELSDSLRDKTQQNDILQAQRDDLQTKLADITRDRDNIKERLTDSDRSLMDVRQTLKEETELKLILESENQDFEQALEELEQRCKRMGDELRTMTAQYESADKERRRLERSVDDERKIVVQLKKKVHRVEEELTETRMSKTAFEKEGEQLREKLSSSEQRCEDWSRDNEDLRAWVGDLERQATELQSAASDFEEVEQSLRDTLDSQRQTAEQNAKLVDELRREREALWGAQARARKAERERDASQNALTSSQERVSEMERRLKEIRESNVAKLSASEAGVRAKAQQCAELESALLEAERRVAELGRSSDEAFSAKADARRAEEEIVRLRERCEGAESRVETLEVDLQKAKEEAEQVREASSGEALRALEAEHNELLVYLADLELELTTVKDKEKDETDRELLA